MEVVPRRLNSCFTLICWVYGPLGDIEDGGTWNVVLAKIKRCPFFNIQYNPITVWFLARDL